MTATYSPPTSTGVWVVRHRRLDPATARAQVVGELDHYMEAKFVLRFNDVGTWTILLPGGHPETEAFLRVDDSWDRHVHEIEVRLFHERIHEDWYRCQDEGSRIVIDGPITSVKRTFGPTGHFVTISGVDENAWLAGRLLLPEGPLLLYPNERTAPPVPPPRPDEEPEEPLWEGLAPWDELPATGRFTTPRVTTGGTAAALLWNNIFAQLGPTADEPRRAVPLEPNSPVANAPVGDGGGAYEHWFPGDDATVSWRYPNLLEACQEMAGYTLTMPEAWPLGFYLRGRRLYLRYPRDTHARFSDDIGTVASWESSFVADEATVTLVAGQGEMEDRQFAVANARGRPALYDQPAMPPIFDDVDYRWPWTEDLKDRRDTNDWPALVRAALDAARKGVERPSLSMAVVDTPGQTFGADYFVGDVAEAWAGGVTLREVVRQVTVTLRGGDAISVEPLVGEAKALSSLGVFERLGQLETAVHQLNASK